MTDPRAFRPHHQKVTAADIEYLVRYFASAGSLYDNRPASLHWLPWASGKELRHFWRMAKDEVFHVVTDRAYALMEQEFGSGKPARNFDSWPTAARREIYAECRNSGCLWTFTPMGHVAHINGPSFSSIEDEQASYRAQLEESIAQYKAREEAGTLGKHDPRFDD